MNLHQISMVLSNHELPEALRHSILDGIKQLQIESTINTLIEEPVSLIQTQDPPSEYSSETLVLFDEGTETHPNQEPSLPPLGEFDDLGDLQSVASDLRTVDQSAKVDQRAPETVPTAAEAGPRSWCPPPASAHPARHHAQPVRHCRPRAGRGLIPRNSC